MKKLLLSGACLLSCSLLFAQQNTVPTGGDASGSGGTVSYTVGQIDYSNASGTDGSTNEGVQQPYEFFDPDASLEEIGWNAQLYPNPTSDNIILELQAVPVDARYAIYDAKGKLLTEGAIDALQTTIDMRAFPPAVYQLQLQEKTNSTSIQFIKH